MPEKRLIIAIDGPAGSGKSTLAKGVAKQLGYLYLDTGAMYRAITWVALKNKVDLKQIKKLQEIASKSKLELQQVGDQTKVCVNGQDVSEEIREPLISNHVSTVAKVKEVRDCMVAHQRRIGEQGGVVLEGRDIGTVVFPHADIKFYVEANMQERARRRQIELKEMGIELSVEKLVRDLRQRDSVDQSREVSPLKPAEDAIRIDSTNLTIQEKTDLALSHIQKVLKEK